MENNNKQDYLVENVEELEVADYQPATNEELNFSYNPVGDINFVNKQTEMFKKIRERKLKELAA